MSDSARHVWRAIQRLNRMLVAEHEPPAPWLRARPFGRRDPGAISYPWSDYE